MTAIPSAVLKLVPLTPAAFPSEDLKSFPRAPLYLPEQTEWLRQVSYVLNGVMDGRMNNTGSISLTANSATTTITLAKGRLGEYTQVYFFPLTANAAAEVTAMYVSGRDVANNQFTITHNNAATTNRKFRFALIG